MDKIARLLPRLANDLIVFRLFIRKNIDKYHPGRLRFRNHLTYSDKKPALAFFEGSMSFILRKRRLYSHFKGQTILEAFNLGFDRIGRELKKYKDTHFLTKFS